MVEPDECGSHTVESYTQCSSPSASVQGPFSRKRPPSPELTTCSLSTFGQPCGKKICFSSFSDSRQPQSVLTAARLHSRDRNTVQPEHTALTSAVTVDDDDDLDEAVSSFRAPPGHLPHNDCFAHALPQALPATFGKQPHHTIFDSVHTATSYTPAAGLLSCKSEPFTAQQQSALPTHASSLMCLPRQYSLPITLSFPGLSINTLQVRNVSPEASSIAGANCNTFCHPAEKALHQMQPRLPAHELYQPHTLPGHLDIEE